MLEYDTSTHRESLIELEVSQWVCTSPLVEVGCKVSVNTLGSYIVFSFLIISRINKTKKVFWLNSSSVKGYMEITTINNLIDTVHAKAMKTINWIKKNEIILISTMHYYLVLVAYNYINCFQHMVFIIWNPTLTKLTRFISECSY